MLCEWESTSMNSNISRLYSANFFDLDMVAFVAIHRLGKTPSFGATRVVPYDSEQMAQDDAVRLSQLMTRKSLISGLHCGGAKATIYLKEGVGFDEKRIRAYSKWIKKLSSEFVTGADMGVSQEMVRQMRKIAPNMVGTYVDPVYYTVQGLTSSMVSVNQLLLKKGSPQQLRVAVQGLGKIGMGVANQLLNIGATVIACDIDEKTARSAKSKLGKILIVSPDAIYDQKVDIFAPCAGSKVLNGKTILRLKCSAVCGGANNQLSSPNIFTLLHEKHILYAPDYIVNSGGLISVYFEYLKGRPSKKLILHRLSIVQKQFRSIIRESIIKNISPMEISEDRCNLLSTEQFGVPL